MRNFTCPRCNERTISPSDKFLAGWWQSVHCGHCGARLSALPLAVMLVHFIYVWIAAWIAGIYVYQVDPVYYAVAVAIWAVIESINVMFMPLVILKPLPQK